MGTGTAEMTEALNKEALDKKEASNKEIEMDNLVAGTAPTTKDEAVKAEAIKQEPLIKETRNKLIALAIGVFLTIFFSIIVLAKISIPVVTPLAAIFLGLGPLGIVLGAGLALFLPRLLVSLPDAKKTAGIGITLFKAAVFAGVGVVLAVFVMPPVAGLLAGIKALSFLSAFSGGHGVLSIIMTALSALITFVKTIYGDKPTWNRLKDNPGRALELAVGGTLLLGGGISLTLLKVGVLAVPAALPVVLFAVAMFVGAALAFGLVTTLHEFAKSRPVKREEGIEMGDLNPGKLPVPTDAPTNTLKVGSNVTTPDLSNDNLHPAKAAQIAATVNEPTTTHIAGPVA
jgi:hypothetical protein